VNEILRILDASFNRAREGLRVVEDGLRFSLNDRPLTFQIKKLRHDLSKTVFSYLTPEDLNRSRQVLLDSSRHDDFRGEKYRLTEIIMRNLRRTGEALRTMEEYAKNISPALSNKIHHLRFNLYQIEKQVTLKLMRKEIPPRCLCVILNLNEEKKFRFLSEKVAKAGPHMVQIRYKGEDIPYFLKMTCWLRQILPEETLLLVNDRPDICLVARADGVHLGQKDFPLQAVRILLPDKIIGLTCQNLSQAKTAIKNGADYIATGPVFPTAVKPEKLPIGLERLTGLVKKVTIPVLAIGGINEDNLDRVLATGVNGVAVISAVAASAHPDKTIRQMKKTIEGYL